MEAGFCSSSTCDQRDRNPPLHPPTMLFPCGCGHAIQTIPANPNLCVPAEVPMSTVAQLAEMRDGALDYSPDTCPNTSARVDRSSLFGLKTVPKSALTVRDGWRSATPDRTGVGQHRDSPSSLKISPVLPMVAVQPSSVTGRSPSSPGETRVGREASALPVIVLGEREGYLPPTRTPTLTMAYGLR